MRIWKDERVLIANKEKALIERKKRSLAHHGFHGRTKAVKLLKRACAPLLRFVFADWRNRKLLHKRAMMALLWFAIVDVALCCLFILVPSTRL